MQFLPHRKTQKIESEKVNCRRSRGLSDSEFCGARAARDKGKVQAAQPRCHREGEQEKTLVRQPTAIRLENGEAECDLEEQGRERRNGDAIHFDKVCLSLVR